MNIHRDDPRWTAYVLGELNDADRAEIERELESSAEAREIVDEIKMMTMLLADELGKESPAASAVMAPEQRRAVREAAAVNERPAKRPWMIGGFAVAAIAALLVFAVAVPSLLRTPTRELDQAAPARAARRLLLLPHRRRLTQNLRRQPWHRLRRLNRLRWRPI